jgi:PD-(D/E)XK nuclease superfamily
MAENEVTSAIIGSAIEVHRRLGPGLLETVYRRCLAYELRKKGFDVIEEKPIPLDYDDLHDPCAFRADLLVNGLVVVSPGLAINLGVARFLVGDQLPKNQPNIKENCAFCRYGKSKGRRLGLIGKCNFSRELILIISWLYSAAMLFAATATSSQ